MEEYLLCENNFGALMQEMLSPAVDSLLRANVSGYNTSMADDLLTRGAGDRDATAFATMTEQLGLDLDAYTGSTTTQIALDGHVQQLTDGLSLMADIVMRPRFDEDAVARARSQRLGQLAQSLDEPSTIATLVGDVRYYGTGHPLAHAAMGTASSIEALDADQLQESWTARAIPSHSTLVVAGAIDQATLTTALEEAFSAWAPPAAPLVAVEIGPADPQPGHYLIDNPGASQTTLRVLMPGPAPGDADRAAGELAGIVLGGTFTSRLNRLLREEKGYTYGARARLDARAGYGMWLANTAVRADASGDALVDLLAEITRLTEGIDAAELKKSQGASQTRLVGSLDSVAGLASTYAAEASAKRSPSALADALVAKLAATEDHVDAVTKTLPITDAVIVVVGDLTAIRDDVTSKVSADWQTLDRP
jgi:zinc protease